MKPTPTANISQIIEPHSGQSTPRLMTLSSWQSKKAQPRLIRSAGIFRATLILPCANIWVSSQIPLVKRKVERTLVFQTIFRVNLPKELSGTSRGSFPPVCAIGSSEAMAWAAFNAI